MPVSEPVSHQFHIVGISGSSLRMASYNTGLLQAAHLIMCMENEALP